jgi:hypothetical protein
VFEIRVLRKMFVPKREEVIGEWRRLHTEDLLDMCSSPGITRANISGRMKLAEHMNLVGERKNHTSFGGETCRKETTWNTWE